VRQDSCSTAVAEVGVVLPKMKRLIARLKYFFIHQYWLLRACRGLGGSANGCCGECFIHLPFQLKPAKSNSMKISTGLFALVLSCFAAGCTSTSPAPHAYTPPNGSLERSAIIVGVKEALAKQGRTNVVVQVPYLKVNSGWAWIQVNPESADGKQHYESQSGLLQEKAKKWTLLEWMPAEEGTDTKAYFKKLKAKYPQAPADIVPQ
jgi:hypothetical protein